VKAKEQVRTIKTEKKHAKSKDRQQENEIRKKKENVD
jgi:hypothetical protein